MDITYYKNKYEPIDGKWYFVKKLGSGAFGTVFEVERRDHTNMKAAVKIVSVPANSSEVESYREENYELDEQSISSYFYGFVEEFTKEIQLMSKVRGHGNVVTIEDYDVKKHTDEIGWDIFIRMELLTPMNKYFKDCPPETSDVIKLGIDICKALEVCQKYKITHRDIKPSNIFLSSNGDYKLGDFGVSRTLEKTSSGLSKKGTYTYMAPEVFRGEAYGSNVDIYSLGIVMYRLLNNNMEPFITEKKKTHVDEETALWRRMKGEAIPAPVNAEGRLSEIVIKACAFNPKDRYESPAQMREELEAILYGKIEEKTVFVNEDKVEFEESNDESIISLNIINENFEDIEDEKTVGIFNIVSDETQEEDEDVPTVDIFDIPPTVAIEEDSEDKGLSLEKQDGTSEQVQKKRKFPKRNTVVGMLIGIGILCAVLMALPAYKQHEMSRPIPLAENGIEVANNEETSTKGKEEIAEALETTETAEEKQLVLDVALADYYSDYYARIMDIVAEELDWVIHTSVRQAEDVETLVETGEVSIGVSFEGMLSDEMIESKVVSRDNFVFLAADTEISNDMTNFSNTIFQTRYYNVGVVNGTLEHAYAVQTDELRKYFKEIRACDSLATALYLLKQGEIDCLFIQEEASYKIMKDNPEFTRSSVELGCRHTFKVSLENQKLMESLDNVLSQAMGKINNSVCSTYKNPYFTQWSSVEQAEYEEYQRNPEKRLEAFYTIEKPKAKDSIFLGSYYTEGGQQNSLKEIEWIVLEQKEEKLLMVSKYVLEKKQYHHTEGVVKWEDCSLRAWLNDDFFNTAFSEEEREVILSEELFSGDAASTIDNVFILSRDEAINLMYLEELIAYTSDDVANEGTPSWWWERCDTKNGLILTCTSEGKTHSTISPATNKLGVRPAIWIDVAKYNKLTQGTIND